MLLQNSTKESEVFSFEMIKTILSMHSLFYERTDKMTWIWIALAVILFIWILLTL